MGTQGEEAGRRLQLQGGQGAVVSPEEVMITHHRMARGGPACW